MTVPHPERCPICGSSGAEIVFSYDSPDRYEVAVGIGIEDYSRSWVRCTGCGFHYSRYSRPYERLDQLYADGYRDKATWRPASTEEVFRRVVALPPEESETKERVAWIKSVWSELRAAGMTCDNSPPWRLLDIGGATGVFAYEFRDPCWLPYIVDPAAEGQFLENVHGIPYAARAYAPGLFGGLFDLISLIYALEHLREPEAVLADVRADLAPGGLVYIEVPDAVAFAHKPADDDIFNACHLWMFDPASLLALFTRVGLQLFALRRLKTKRGHFAIMALGGAS